MRKGFTLLEVLIVISIISVLVLVFMIGANDYIARADLQKQKLNGSILESSIKQHKLENETLPFDTKITKEISAETKKIIEQQLKSKGASFDDVKDSFYALDKKKIKQYVKGQMDDFDRYFSSNSSLLEGMVFTYDTLKTKNDGEYSGSYAFLEIDGGNEVKPPEPPTVCSTDPSTDGTIRLPAEGAGVLGNPYLIKTIGEFQSMKLSPNSHFKLKNDIEACVTKDWNSGLGFEPLTSFTGSLINSSFSISNLYINRPSEDNIGIVKQLKIGPGNLFAINLKSPSITGRNNVGTIVGTLSQGTLDGARVENGATKGEQNVGGLIGFNDTYASVFRSNFQGEVSGNTNVGGIAGKTTQLDVTDSYLRGKVTGVQSVGGLVGNRTDSFTAISKVYLDVDVKGTSNVQIFNGTSSKRDITSNIFYNKDKIGSVVVDIGTGKTTAEMKNQATFTGFDFTAKWIIDPTKNDGLPYLR
ncbi:type II secretion system protein [Bacillus cereus]|nr:type II secretion system protein [Bacillus cereus]